MPKKAHLISAITAAIMLSACSDSSDNSTNVVPPPIVEPEPEATLSAEIRRTEYGIPHIKADDWRSLGYGYGYAYSQDNYCVTMREIILGSGRSSELMGPDEGNVEIDLLYRYLNGNKEEFKARFVDSLPQFAQDLTEGYVAGMNRYLRETGVENLPEGDAGCRNAPWVQEVDAVDLWRYLRRIALGGSTDQGIVRDALISVPPPVDAVAGNSSPVDFEPALAVSAFPGKDLSQLGALFKPSEAGSNAIAAGGDATQDGGAVLLGNPHQPWQGSGRWYEAHLTIPGEYDVAGASLQGLPWIGIGFNKDIAWTHTVAYASRFTLYELKLNPNNFMEYEYDGQWRSIESTTVSVKEQLDDGSLVDREKTFYSSHYGMILDLGGVNPMLGGWPMFNGSLMALRDANLLTGVRSAQEYVTKAQAASIEEYTAALSDVGNPVFHDVAADRHGTIFYGNTSAIPHVSQAKYDDCVIGIGALLATATDNAFIGLDGSRSDCEWGEDADSPQDSNLFGYSSQPKIIGRGVVGNSNNSYWLTDATMPLEGFPVVQGWMGHEGKQQFLRTRINHLMIADRLAGSDNLSPSAKFNQQTMKDLMYSNRVYGAEIVLDDVLEICRDRLAEFTDNGISMEEEVLTNVCAVLDNWDRRVDVDSVGAQVFTEFWKGIREVHGSDFQNVVVSDEFWKVDFDPTQPLVTPSGIDRDIDANRELVIATLLQANQRLEDAGVALDAPWGDVQVLQRNNEQVPIHGGAGTMGVFGAISANLTQGGYLNPGSGNSYIQVVSWDGSDCPVADTILTHSQSTDPASDHYADQSHLYARKEWLRFPFCEQDIVDMQIGDTVLLEE